MSAQLIDLVNPIQKKHILEHLGRDGMGLTRVCQGNTRYRLVLNDERSRQWAIIQFTS